MCVCVCVCVCCVCVCVCVFAARTGNWSFVVAGSHAVNFGAGLVSGVIGGGTRFKIMPFVATYPPKLPVRFRFARRPRWTPAAVTPFDVVKVRQQAQGHNASVHSGASGAARTDSSAYKYTHT
jgi:hypothetical protein